MQMQFLHPILGLATLAGGVSLIVLMYLLKQKYKEKQIPSLFLWDKVFVQTKAIQPWQKLKKSLLLFLQLAAAALLALAISGPFVASDMQSQNYVLALDCSLSMQATDESPTRFAAAKKDIQRMVEQAAPTASFSLVILTDQPYLAVSDGEKSRLLRLLDEAQPTAGSVDWEKASQIMTAECEKLDAQAALYTDQYGNLEALSPIEEVYGMSAENSAVTMLSHRIQDDGLYVMTQVHHFGENNVEKQVTLYTDGVAFDTQTVQLTANADTSVVFQAVPQEAKTLEVRLSPKDVLPLDDARYEGLAVSDTQKVLLVGAGNVFLEKALALQPKVQVYTTQSAEEQELSGYGLYIFDGVMPDTLPTDGHILFLQPSQEQSLIQVGETRTFSDTVRGVDDTLLENTGGISFALQEGTPLSADWGQTFLRAEGQTLGLYGEYNGQKIAALGFDLHKSDFPLQAGFPILLYDLIEWYFPENAAGLSQAEAGQTVSFDLQPSTQQAVVQTAAGTEIAIAPPFPAQVLTDTKTAGLYLLRETDATGAVRETPFGVNPKTLEESDLREQGEAGTQTQEVKTIRAGRSIAGLALLLLLVVLLIEWRVNCREV